MPKSKRTAPPEQRAQPVRGDLMGRQAFHHAAGYTEAAAVCSHCVDRVQQIHQHHAERTTGHLRQAAEQMRRLSTPLELFGVQSILLNAMARDWGQVTQDLVKVMQDATIDTLRVQSVLLTSPSESGLEGSSSPVVAEPETISSTYTSASPDAMVETNSLAAAATAAALESWCSMVGQFPSAWMAGKRP